MRFVYMGTPEFAVPPLAALAKAGLEPALVYSQPDRPAGRGRASTAPPVKEWALAHGLPVEQPLDANSAASLSRLRELEPDLFVVVAYGFLLSPELLAAPRLGAINLHGSLLPDYRGASPVAQALLDGRRETGVSTLWMDAGIDTGDVIAQRALSIGEEESAGELTERLSHEGARLLVETLHDVAAGRARRTPQDRDRGTYCRKLKKSDGVIDWSLDAERVARHVRAMTPWPGAFTDLEVGKTPPMRILVERARATREAMAGGTGTVRAVGNRVLAACGQGSAELLQVRPAGRRSLPAAEWWRGLRLEEARFVRPAVVA